MGEHVLDGGVEGAVDGQAAAIEDVGVGQPEVARGLDVLVSEEFLDGADVPSTTLRINSAVFEEVSGERVTEDVRGDVLFDAGVASGASDGLV